MTCALLTCGGPLETRLGVADCAGLRAELRRRGEAWAAAVSLSAGPRFVPAEELATAALEVFERDGGPLLVASVDAPRLSPQHATMACADLEQGADASVGPGMDGGWYLAALARPHAALLGLLAEAIDGPDVMGRTLAVAQAAGLEVGLLRMERLLRTARDAAALRADPLTPEPVRTALRRLG